MSKCPCVHRTFSRLVKITYPMKALGVDKERVFFELAV